MDIGENRILRVLSRFGLFKTNTELENKRNRFLAYFFSGLLVAHIALVILDSSTGRQQFLLSHALRIGILIVSLYLIGKNKSFLGLNASMIVFFGTVLANAFSLPLQSLDSLVLFPLLSGLFIVSKRFYFNIIYLIASIGIFITALYFQVHYQTPSFNFGQIIAASLIFICFFVSMSYFVYEFKYLGKQLNEKNKELGDAVEELSVQNKKLEDTNDFVTQVMTVIAHDLRNQFSNLIGYASLLNANFDRYDADKNKKFIAQLLNSSENGHNILENLLSWARSHSGNLKLNYTSTGVLSLCKTIVSEMEFHAKQKNLIVTVEAADDFHIETDPTILGSIIRNLFSNSLKFSPVDRSINVIIEKTEENIIIRVRNYGTPIPEEKQKLLFNKKLKESTMGTTGEKGTGLGLLICQDFTELLGGILAVDSSEEYTQFSVTLPLRKTNESY